LCRYARVANNPYSLNTANETSFETHFTVVRYDDDQAVAASQVCAWPSQSLCRLMHSVAHCRLACDFDGPITGHVNEGTAVCFPQIGLTNEELRPELEAQGVHFTALEDALRDLARNVVRAGAAQVHCPVQ